MTIGQLTLPSTLGESFHNQFARLCALRHLGYMPASILDIGAYHGGWSVMVKAIWPAARVLTIEADEGCRVPLTRDGHDFEIAVLSDKDGYAGFYRCNDREGEGNSLFRENSVHSFTPVVLPTKSLASLAAGRTFNLIKMDCQGAESRIIDGGEDVVKAADLVLLETQLQAYNEGAPFIDEVIERMSLLGFRVFDIVDFHYNGRGLMIQADILFAQAASPLFAIRPLS